jgi:WD40 repeat protein
MVSLADLPWKFLLDCSSCDASITGDLVGPVFTSPDTIMFCFPDGMATTWKIGQDDFVSDVQMLKLDYSQTIRVKNGVFSDDGKLIAVNPGSEILLFSCDGKFLSSVFKVTEDGKLNASCLTFSSDNSLLLFCIQDSNNDQSFYVWDVKNKILSGRIHFPFKMPVDCCCFARDNRQIFFCNASTVLILQYPPTTIPCPTVCIPNMHHTAFPKCNHCGVSSDNKLLVCCIANEILIHPLDGTNAFWKVPHNHSGRVEFCKFLKGNRYLMSYGIDGVVFLFDLLVWKSVAYARQESIVNIAVSPDENKVVCLRSSREVSVVNLHGLKCGLPSDFQLPSKFRFRLSDRSHEPRPRQVISPSAVPAEIEMEDLCDEDAQLSPYSSESSDED